MIQVDLQNVRSFIPLPYEAALSPRLRIAHDRLQTGSGAGGEFAGWVRLPEDYDKAEFARIKAAAKKIQRDSQALVVIGIGGSYLGARGAIELLKPLPGKDDPQIFFVGNVLSADTLCDTLDRLGTLTVTLNGETVAQIPLCAGSDVPRIGFFGILSKLAGSLIGL